MPSCSYPVAEGMKVRTHSQRAVQAPQDHRGAAARQPPRRLPVLRAQRRPASSRSSGRRARRARAPLHGRQARATSSTSPGPPLAREPGKCILCGKCVRVCEEIQGVAAIDFIGRGSATKVGPGLRRRASTCPAASSAASASWSAPRAPCTSRATSSRSSAPSRTPTTVVVVQHAPAVSVTLARGVRPARRAATWPARSTAALRRLGFDRVFDTSFSADLTVMEEASELVHRMERGGPLPMMTSCSPGWIKFVEEFYPEFIGQPLHVQEPPADARGRRQDPLAQREGSRPRRSSRVAVMPCTAKKFEAARARDGRATACADIDAVLTTRELRAAHPHARPRPRRARPGRGRPPLRRALHRGQALRRHAAASWKRRVRTAHFLLTGEELEHLEVARVPRPRRRQGGQGQDRRPRARRRGVSAAWATPASSSSRSKAGRSDLHFIEVMTCPGGCVAGGGQLLGTDPKALRARMDSPLRHRRGERRCASPTRTRPWPPSTRSSSASPWARRATTCCTRTTPRAAW